MAQLTLTIVGDVSDVQNRIQGLRQLYQNNPIQIKVQASGVDNVTKELIQYARQVARTAEAEAKAARARADAVSAISRMTQAQARLQTQQEATRTETQRTATEQARLQTQTEATNTATRQAVVELGRLQVQQERTNTEVQRGATEQARLATQEERTRTQQERLNVEMQRGENIANSAANRFNIFGGILSRVSSIIVNQVIRAFRDALKTLQAVDDELVAVRKVTGFSQEQIDTIKQQAFEVASAYGETADAYLESVAAFSRAGYREQATDLAELATKTQIVGDTTAEVANQFLISVDAAYKYGGSIEKLSKVLDGANEIDNKYATSIEKIASGMGIVAPVAAQMHVSVEELAASIGTITAVTQRSGTEAARALRALFLNIAGDTKTEIDEGITWTTGEIEGLRDVIKQYSREAYDAAQATGSIIDPMRAMEGLAKSMEEGILTEQKLIEMVSDLGGKLRTSQLLAIIQNWDMYQSMLQDYAGAIGSADREVENALDSWTRKTNQLKNTFSEFINHIISSDTIKGAVDFLTGIVKTFDNVIIVFQKLTGNIDQTTQSYAEHQQILAKIQQQYDQLNGEGDELQRLKDSADELTDTEKRRLGILEYQSEQLEKQIKKEKELAYYAWRGGDTVGLRYAVSSTGTLDVQYYSKVEEEANKAKLALSQLDYEYQKGIKTEAEYIEGVKGIISSISKSAEAIKNGKDAGIQLEEYEETILEIYDALTEAIGEYTEKTQKNTKAKQDNATATGEVSEANATLKKALEEVEQKSSLTYGTIEELDRLYPGFSKKILDVNGNLTEEGQAALSTKNAFYALIAEMITASNTGLSFSGQISALYDLATAAGLAGDAIAGIFSGVFPEFDENGQLDVQAEKTYIGKQKSGKSVTSADILKRFQDALKKRDYATAPSGYSGGEKVETEEEKRQKEQQEELNRLKQIVTDEKARYALLEEMGASAEDLAAQALVVRNVIADEADYLDSIGANYSDIAALVKERLEWQKKAVIEQKDETEKQKEELQKHKDKVSFLKQELSFLKASGATDEEIIAKQKEIQRALHDQAEYMRSIKADEKDIKALSTEWWEIQNDILDTTEKIAKKLRDDVADVLGNIVTSLQTAAEKATQPLQDELDALTAAHNVTEDRREEEEKILAVQKARIALENAQRERNVRQYNAKSGQWEWVANAKNVEDAQKNLIDAENALEKYRAEQNYKTQKETLDKQIKATNSAFDALGKAIKEAADAIKNGKMSFEEAYSYIQSEMQRIYGEYANDLDGFEIDLESALGECISTLDGSSQALLSVLGSLQGVKDGYAQLNTILASMPSEYRSELITSLAKIFGDKTLSNDAKSIILNDIHSIVGNSDLNDKAKMSILSDISVIFGSNALRAETKQNIVSGIAALVGNSSDAQSAVLLFKNYITTAIAKAKDPEGAINNLVQKILDGGGKFADIDELLKNVDDETNKLLLMAQMKTNSMLWWMYDDGTGNHSQAQKDLAKQNQDIGNKLGFHYSHGQWYEDAEFTKPIYTIDAATKESIHGSLLNKKEDYAPLFQSLADEIADAIRNIEINVNVSGGGGTSSASSGSSGKTAVSTTPTPSDSGVTITNYSDGTTVARDSNGNTQTSQTGQRTLVSKRTMSNGVTAYVYSDGTIEGYMGGKRIYDQGGILRGIGGIKATREDEMVLPPDATKAMLNAEASGAFNALLNHLGIVTAAANQIAGFGGGVAQNSIGEQNNGDSYNFGNISLSEQQAKGMTVYQLAQLGRTLALQRGN